MFQSGYFLLPYLLVCYLYFTYYVYSCRIFFWYFLRKRFQFCGEILPCFTYFFIIIIINILGVIWLLQCLYILFLFVFDFSHFFCFLCAWYVLIEWWTLHRRNWRGFQFCYLSSESLVFSGQANRIYDFNLILFEGDLFLVYS